jgi:hypothetical protein
MPDQRWSQSLVSQDAAGVTYDTYTTAKSVINQNCLYGFYANYFKPGTRLRITVNMSVKNIVTTPGTVEFQVKLGSVVVWSSGAVQLNATAHAVLPAKLVIDLTCQLINTTVGGAIAKFMGVGILTGVMFTKTAGQTDSAQGDQTILVPQSAPALGTAFDSTISQVLDFWAGFSISNSGNGVRIDQYDVEQLN